MERRFGWFDARVTARRCSAYRMLVIGSTDERLIDGDAVVYYTLFIILN